MTLWQVLRMSYANTTLRAAKRRCPRNRCARHQLWRIYCGEDFLYRESSQQERGGHCSEKGDARQGVRG